MKNPHSELVNQALICLSKTELGRFWKNQTGVAVAAKYIDGKWIPEIPYRVVRFGLPGSTDILGQLEGGFLFAGECKTGSGKLSLDQKNFREMILKFGGCYLEIRDVEQAVKDLKEYLGNKWKK